MISSCLYSFRLILAFVCVVIFTSCGPKVIYDEKKDIRSPWKYNDTYQFSFEVADTVIAYDLHLLVDHQASFGTENIYIKVQTIFPGGKKVEQPLSLQLAGGDGLWIGDCNDKDCEIDILLAAKAYYKQKGKYTVSINQHSRSEELDGINSLNLRVNYAE